MNSVCFFGARGCCVCVSRSELLDQLLQRVDLFEMVQVAIYVIC